MNKNQKTYLRNWTLRKQFTFKKGGKISLQTIIDKVFKYANVSGLALPEYMNEVHPFLYFNFLVDWTKTEDAHVPVGFNTGLEFGRHIVKEWQRECWEQKFYNYDLFSNYDNISQLREAYEAVMGDNLSYPDGFHALEERLYVIRQEYLDKAEAERKAEEERLESERQLRLAEDRAIEAQRAAEELRRKRKDHEAETVARSNRMAYSAHTGDAVSRKPEPEPASKPSAVAVPTFADVMPEQLKHPEQYTIESLISRLQAEWSRYAETEVCPCMYFDPQQDDNQTCVLTIGEGVGFRCSSFRAAIDAAFARLSVLVAEADAAKRKAAEKASLQQQLADIEAEHARRIAELQQKINAL